MLQNDPTLGPEIDAKQEKRWFDWHALADVSHLMRFWHRSHRIGFWNRSHRIGVRNRSRDIHRSQAHWCTGSFSPHWLLESCSACQSVCVKQSETTAANFFSRKSEGLGKKCEWGR